MDSLPSLPGTRAAKQNARAILLAAGALVLIAAAAVLSHEWDSDGGLDVIYLILALVVLALAFPFTREWLANATNVKLPGGLEITRQFEDATETVSWLPVVDEEKEDEAGKRLKLVGTDWFEDPSAALRELRSALRERIAWTCDELYPGSGKPRTDQDAIKRLEADRLINPQEARVAKAVLEVSGRVVAGAYDADDDKTRNAVVAFIEGADRAVYQLRLIALDTNVRHALKKKNLKLLDFRGQPKGRWPDFYAFDPMQLDRPPLRVAFRMARTPKSDLVVNTRGRMREKWPETPLDQHVQRVIVIPNTSKTDLEPDSEIPAMKRDEFFVWVDGYFARGDL